MFKTLSALKSQKTLLLPYLASRFSFGTTSSSFFVHQFSTPCLAEFAYYVESNGEAVIIDPLREVKPYLELAKSRNAKIKYIFESHFHADFVSGHLDLVKSTGAKIVYGPSAQAEYDLYSAKDGEEFKIGNIALKVLHTPGHTLESSCFLLLDEGKKPYCVFTGDTLFLGEVGRPDLAVKSNKITKEDLAGMMYESLKTKILPLPDDVIVYPAHGAGSSCGKNISAGSSCTIGEQKRKNYALQPMDKEHFIQLIASDLPTPPKYFFHDAKLNKTNFPSLDEVLNKNIKPLSIQQVKDLASKGAKLLDCRDGSDCYATGIIPGSVAISLSTPFAVWVGTLLDAKDKIIIIAEPGREEEAITRLARVGFDNCEGFLKGGIQEWIKNAGPVENVRAIDPQEHLKEMKDSQEIKIVDVRNPPEWSIQGVYKGSKRIPLAELENRINEIDPKSRIHLLCKSGVRSTIAFSILKKHGFEDLTVIKGGADKLVETGYQLDKLNN